MVSTTSTPQPGPAAPEPGVVKPGWATTEFYQTLLVNVIAGIVAIVTIFKTNFNLNGVQAAVPAVALAAATIAQTYYALSRARVKAAAQDASARVKSANAAAEAAKATATVPTAGARPSGASSGEVQPAAPVAAIPAPTVLTVHFDDLRVSAS
jgi:hypothetical protein